ncbi:MAG: hypothetical protein ACEQSH_00935 [Bacteroidia bacterium]
MGFLSSAQKAAIQTAIQTDETTADLWRNPSESGGKTGARVDTGANIPIRLRPAGQDDSNLKLIPLANPLNAARVTLIGKVAVDADVEDGDELRIDGARYLVEGFGIFTNARMLALSKIKGAG